MWEVKRLSNHLSKGTSGMGASHIKGWMEEVRQNEREEAAAEKKAESTMEVSDRTSVGGQKREGGRRLQNFPTGRG